MGTVGSICAACDGQGRVRNSNAFGDIVVLCWTCGGSGTQEEELKIQDIKGPLLTNRNLLKPEISKAKCPLCATWNALPRDLDESQDVKCEGCGHFSKYDPSLIGIKGTISIGEWPTNTRIQTRCTMRPLKDNMSDETKPRLTLIPRDLEERTARIFEAGLRDGRKPGDWQKMSVEHFRDALQRHVRLYSMGDESEDHLAAIAANTAIIGWYEERNESD